jgi:hypothetical protein
MKPTYATKAVYASLNHSGIVQFDDLAIREHVLPAYVLTFRDHGPPPYSRVLESLHEVAMHQARHIRHGLLAAAQRERLVMQGGLPWRLRVDPHEPQRAPQPRTQLPEALPRLGRDEQHGKVWLLEFSERLEVRVRVLEQVGLVRNQQCGQLDGKDVGLVERRRDLLVSSPRIRRPMGHETDLALLQHRLHSLDVQQAIGIPKVHDQQRRVSRLKRAAEPGQRVLRRNCGQVQELEMHVFPAQHAGLRIPRRVRIRPALRARAREPRMQQRLAAVRRSQERDLRGTLRPHDECRPAARPAPLRPLEFLVEFLDPVLEVRLQVIRPLVLGDYAQHQPQAIEPLLRIARLAKGVRRGLVLG